MTNWTGIERGNDNAPRPLHPTAGAGGISLRHSATFGVFYGSVQFYIGGITVTHMPIVIPLVLAVALPTLLYAFMVFDRLVRMIARPDGASTGSGRLPA